MEAFSPLRGFGSSGHVLNLGSMVSNKLETVDDLLKRNAAVLPKRIQFKRAEKPDVHTEILRAKYEPINKSKEGGKKGIKREESKNKKEIEEEELTKPRYELFTEDKIAKFLKWDQVRRIGSGLNNLGNTCFLNSVLQCLTYTPPFANYCLKKEHSKTCQITSFCMFCQLEAHVIRALTSSGAVSPKGIVSNIRNISKVFRPGRQEDSHEFLRYVIEGLQKSCLYGMDKKLDPRIAETSVIHRIFGGYLQSQVECAACKHKSNTFDPFLDLSLEIRGCDSVEKALSQFTRPEVLDEANKYKCLKCLKAVRARKQFTIKVAPNVLTIQLKRFTYTGFFGGKIAKPVSFPTTLDLKPYLSDKKSDNPVYQLYGVLVHSGGSTHSGHYYSFVKNSAGIWHLMDDSSVRQVSAETALKQSAYMLFYVRENARDSSLAEPEQVKSDNVNKTTPVGSPEPKKVTLESKKVTPEPKKEVNRGPLLQKRKQEEPQEVQQPQTNNKKVKTEKIKPMLDEVPTTTYLFTPPPSKPNGLVNSLKRQANDEKELQTPSKKTKREYNGTSNTPIKVELVQQSPAKQLREINATKNVQCTISEKKDTNIKVAVESNETHNEKENQTSITEGEVSTVETKALLNGHVKGLNGHAKGINGATKEMNGHAKGINGHAKEINGDTKEINGHAKGLNGHAKGMNGHAKEINGHAKEVNGHAKEMNGHAKGINGHAKGLNGHAKEKEINGDTPLNGNANGQKEAFIFQEPSVINGHSTNEKPKPDEEAKPMKPQKISTPSAKADVVLWDESLTQEWTKKDALERKPKFDLEKRKKQVEMLQTLTGFKSNQFSAQVDSWDEVENKKAHIAAQKETLLELAPQEIKRDSWDVEYDKGQVKKVKTKKKITEDQVNPFQEFSKEKRIPYPNGKRNRVKGAAKSFRGKRKF